MRLWPPARLSILIYHRVLPQPDPLFPGEVDATAFDRQMGLLKRFFNVIALRDAVRLLRDGALPPRTACITFDDGYADNAEVALPILQRHGLPACFFISSGYLNGGQMWNDRVIDSVRHAGGSELDLSECGLGRYPLGSTGSRRKAIETILASLKYLPFERRQALVAHLASAAACSMQQDLMLTTAQVLALHRAGMEIGAHTVSHPILTNMPEREARADMADGKYELERIIGAPVHLFAYPNGKPGQDFDQRHVEIARQLGFEAAVSTQWGAADHASDLFQLPRFTPWDRDRLRFLLRMGQNMFRRVP
jgi:peptidoglycan/xylan/chitin deacetylase (PgdA/CDA1 family)